MKRIVLGSLTAAAPGAAACASNGFAPVAVTTSRRPSPRARRSPTSRSPPAGSTTGRPTQMTGRPATRAAHGLVASRKRPPVPPTAARRLGRRRGQILGLVLALTRNSRPFPPAAAGCPCRGTFSRALARRCCAIAAGSAARASSLLRRRLPAREQSHPARNIGLSMRGKKRLGRRRPSSRAARQAAGASKHERVQRHRDEGRGEDEALAFSGQQAEGQAQAREDEENSPICARAAETERAVSRERPNDAR